jgi:transposase
VIAIEACAASHHLARLLQSFGHTVKLIASQLVKPYVKRGKNDAADAEALCEVLPHRHCRSGAPARVSRCKSIVIRSGGTRSLTSLAERP